MMESKLKIQLKAVLAVGGVICLYALVVRTGLPKEIGLGFRYQFLPVFVISISVFYISSRLADSLSSVLILVLSSIVFGLALSGLWNGGVSELNTIGGLLPWGDANQYFQSAVQLIHGNLFSSTNGRPLFPGFLATIMGLASGNLQITLAVMVFVSAVASFFAVREVYRSHGWLAGAVMFLLLFQFYRRFNGTTLTENLGFSMGAIGFAMIWRSAARGEISLFLSGIFCLTLGLNARAGAFFVLPAVIVWGVFHFRKSSTVTPVKRMMAGILAMTLGFGCNLFLVKTLVPPSEPAFSNFSFTLYGMLNDGNWTKVYKDHPEILKLNGVDRNRKVYELAIESFKSDPTKLVKGSFRAWIQSRLYSYVIPLYPEQLHLRNNFQKSGVSGIPDLLFQSPYGVINLAFQKIYYLIVNLLFVFGAIYCLFKWRDPYWSLILFSLLGTIVSIPFIPPWDSDDMRIHAATIPFLAVIPAVVLGGIAISNARESYGSNTSMQMVGLGIALFCTIGPVLTKIFHPFSNPSRQLKCPSESVFYFVNGFPGSYVSLTGGKGRHETSSGLEVPVDGFKQGLSVFRILYRQDAKIFGSLPGGMVVAFGGRELRDSNSFLVFEDQSARKISGFSGICGKIESERGRVVVFKEVKVPH